MNDDESIVAKPIKRPLPKTNGVDSDTSTVGTTTSDPSLAELNEKMGKLLELTQAIDWKLWVYLKANNYIE
jgi:hypothetical protein